MGTATTIVIFIVALLLAVGFFLLVLTLVPAINQLRLLLSDLEKTSEQVRNLTENLNEISKKVDREADKVSDILDSSKKSIHIISKTLNMVNRNFLKKSAGLVAFVPAVRLGWNMVKKLKGGK